MAFFWQPHLAQFASDAFALQKFCSFIMLGGTHAVICDCMEARSDCQSAAVLCVCTNRSYQLLLSLLTASYILRFCHLRAFCQLVTNGRYVLGLALLF